MNYQKFSEDELMKLLSTEEDRLSRAAADEFIRRGEAIVPLLSEIVSNQFQWTMKVPKWWAVVHATYILGAIGTELTIIPLLRALRWADAFNCDWVTESLVPILGRIGGTAIAPLKMMAADQTSGCFCRAIAMEGLGMIAWRNPGVKKEISAFVYSVFSDDRNDLEVKQFAGNTLLDLGAEEYRESLLAFGRKEKECKRQDTFYSAHFFDDDVERALKNGGKDMAIYDRDWLLFYDKNEIQKRQQRWREEDKSEVERETEEKVKWISDNNEPYVRQTYVGRNAPCPCGSGKKHKKCCVGK